MADKLAHEKSSDGKSSGKHSGDGHFAGWNRDFEAALEVAKTQKKNLFVLFTGSDWCPPCKQLHENVLETSEFMPQVGEKFVLVVCDNPRDKTLVSEAEQKQYAQLSERYKISGVPTVLITDDTGKPVHRIVGYGGTPASEWIADVITKADEKPGE